MVSFESTSDLSAGQNLKLACRDLYIQALGAMQAANLTDPESWFQVSGRLNVPTTIHKSSHHTVGIHGMPYIEYDHTGGPQNTGSWQGYCPHSVSERESKTNSATCADPT